MPVGIGSALHPLLECLAAVDCRATVLGWLLREWATTHDAYLQVMKQNAPSMCLATVLDSKQVKHRVVRKNTNGEREGSYDLSKFDERKVMCGLTICI